MPNKWNALTNGMNPSTANLVSKMLENELEHYNKMPKVDGPYFCNQDGVFATVEDAANPDYIPVIKFSYPGGPHSGANNYIYDLSEEKFSFGFFATASRGYWPISRVDIPDWLIEEVFKRTPSIYSSKVNDFLKFVSPLVGRTFPKLISNDLVSVQPMTQPVGGIAFYKPKYGKLKGRI